MSVDDETEVEQEDAEYTTDDQEMGFFDHLEILRWHLIRALLGLVVAIIICGIFSDWLVNSVVLRPGRLTDPPLQLINTIPYGQITFYMVVVAVAGFVLASPYMMYEIWKFIQPGLLPKERKYISSIVGYTTLCFVLGMIFAYFIMLPYMLQFFVAFGSAHVQNMITIDEYMDFVLQLILLSGFIFELPMISYFLARFGIVTPAFMRHYRRHSILVILIIAAVVTPTTDPFTMTIFSIPMVLLYEVSIWVAKIAQKKRNTILASEEA
jgi:sec-independent protein translocase protein TatC